MLGANAAPNRGVSPRECNWLADTFFGLVAARNFTIRLEHQNLCRRPNGVVRYVADSSYWMYLIHLPVVIWLQVTGLVS